MDLWATPQSTKQNCFIGYGGIILAEVNAFTNLPPRNDH